MKTKPAPPAVPAARFQLRIQDFYVLAALNFIGTAILLYFVPSPSPQPIIIISVGVLICWLIALAFRPGKLGEGIERLIQLLIRLSIALFISAIVLGGVAAIVIPYCVYSRQASNENAAISACLTFASAQDTFWRVNYAKNGVHEYASSLKQLYGNGTINLVDKKFADAEWSPNAKPKSGYVFKVLIFRGPGAPGGRKSYLNMGGHLTGGYALLAFPADYGVSGVNSIQISSTGTIYFKDLGPDTTRKALTTHSYDPTGWLVE